MNLLPAGCLLISEAILFHTNKAKTKQFSKGKYIYIYIYYIYILILLVGDPGEDVEPCLERGSPSC